MPVPNWLAKVNKRVFNPAEIRRGKRPVITHVGRSSGKTYQVPLDAHAVDGGFVFFLMYGSDSDWVRNVMHAGEARLDIGSDKYQLDTPRLIDAKAAEALTAPGTKMPPGFLKVTEFLQMDVMAG